MRHLLYAAIFFAALGLVSCDNGGSTSTSSSDSTATTAPNKEERNKQIVMGSMDGINKHDAGMVVKDAASNFMDYGDGTHPPMPLDSAKPMLQMWMNAFPDTKGENMVYCADGDYVTVMADWTCTWKNDFMGMKATGRSATYKDVDIFKLDDAGKITEHRSVQNFGCVLGMLGYEPGH